MENNIEKQKAELLDRYVNCEVTIGELSELYDAITAQKPLTADPYADEIFSGRMYNLLFKLGWMCRGTRLSYMPKLSSIINEKGFGRKSREEYIEVMKKYGFTDKL